MKLSKWYRWDESPFKLVLTDSEALWSLPDSCTQDVLLAALLEQCDIRAKDADLTKLVQWDVTIGI
jgi:hypothetical protein